MIFSILHPLFLASTRQTGNYLPGRWRERKKKRKRDEDLMLCRVAPKDYTTGNP
jgi:hypothetical protein